MPFLSFLFQPVVFQELSNWIILTGWAAVLLLLTVLAFFFLGAARARSAWWQYLALLLIAGLGVWSIIVVYNSYQQMLHFYAHLPLHSFNLVSLHLKTPYLAALRACQFQFALLASILVLLLGVAVWQLLRTITKKADQGRLADNHHGYLWMSGAFLLIGLCCLAFSVLLITQFNTTFYAPQDFQFEGLTTLELIGLFTVSLGGPLILLLLGITNIVRHMHPGYRHNLVESR